MEKRRCDQCEYYKEPDLYGTSRCQSKPPVVINNQFHLTAIQPDGYCADWEPKWSDNPVLAEAWAEFKLVHKLITSGGENENN